MIAFFNPHSSQSGIIHCVVVKEAVDRKEVRMTEEILATAHHEAGHAAMAWHLGLGFERVTVVAAGSYTGKVVPRQDSLMDDDKKMLSLAECDRLEKYIMTHVGGPVARAVYGEWENLQQNPHLLMSIVWDFAGVNGDYANTERHIKQLLASQGRVAGAGAELQRQIQFVESAFDLVNRNGELWPTVERLANALVDKRTLEYEEAIRIMAAT